MKCINTANMYNNGMYLNTQDRLCKSPSNNENAQLWKYVLMMYFHNIKPIKDIYVRSIIHSLPITYFKWVKLLRGWKLAKRELNEIWKVIKGKWKVKQTYSQSIVMSYVDKVYKCNIWRLYLSAMSIYESAILRSIVCVVFCNKDHTYTRGNDYDQWSSR